jgi:hypothetical protein
MSEELGVEQILGKAAEREREYDWLGAAEFYRKALNLMSETDSLKLGQVQERMGYAFYRAAMQAENPEEFKERMQRAIEAYKKAQGLYERLTNKRNAARMFRCEAVTKYLDYWLTPVPSEKRKLLDDCLDLEGKALAVFWESGDMLEYGKTYGGLPLIFWIRFNLEWDGQVAKSILEKGLGWGEKAVAALSERGDQYEIAKAFLTRGICFGVYGGFFIEELEEKDKKRLELVKQLEKAVDLSEKVGDTYVLGLLHLWLGGLTGGEESVGHFEKALECGKLIRDIFLIAGGLDFLAYTTYWKAVATEDPEKRVELAEKAIQLYEKAQHQYSVISFMNPRDGVIGPPSGHTEHYFHLAAWETDPEKRPEFLRRSERTGIEALKLAEDSDQPIVVSTTLHTLSKTLEARAYMESDPAQKRSYLKRALKYREKTVEISEQLTPFEYGNLGVFLNYLARIKAQLALIEPNPDDKTRLLEEAMSSWEKCLELLDKVAPYWERMGETWFFASVRDKQDAYATLLTRLYSLTNRPEYLRKAIEISQKAIESASKLDMVSLIAESYWKIAKAQDDLEEHLKAAENFTHATESYKKAAEKIPKLKDLYHDYASYMQAWSEIERARHHSKRQEYGLAKEHFEKAANLHKSLKQWSYLAPNYEAWTQVENAEDLSRKEQSEEALQAFEQAAKLFNETKKTLQTQLSKIENLDEKQMATDMKKATDLRHEYCIARIALEQAKILDKQGDHHSSSEKYGSAAEIFEKITDRLESEQDRKEFQLIITLSRAWEKMMLAEARASPELYMEASQLFEQSSEHSSSEKTSFLTLGHSRFCKALEAGTKFADTGDVALHTVAIQHLESAAKYYVKAGFQSASEYAKGTELLLDAYVHMDNAKKEPDPEKKAKTYAMAEKILQTSAGSFMKAEHPEKREQVLRLLEKVKEERELALSLSEVLHAPSIVSTTTAFTTPTPTQENAVGLERFEHADIQASIITRQRELKVGENLHLEIELVNAGKGPALLIKLTEVIPEGFDLTEKPENYRVEDSYLNMKGKRLDPLKTEEVRIVLKPKVQGVFPLKPRILYLDENGKYKTHEPEPITITVKELGIKGWIKGER